MKNSAQQFIEEHEKSIKPLSIETSLTYFNASISGRQEDYQRVSELEMKLNRIYSDREQFEILKKIRMTNHAKDGFNQRILDVLFNEFRSKQIDPHELEEMVRLSTKTEQAFATFRVQCGNDSLTDNQVDEILRNETDSKRLEEVYLASKQVGAEVVQDVRKLIELRNTAAQHLGFENFHSMQLLLAEQQPEEIDTLFDELDRQTRPAFQKLKAKMDRVLAAKYAIGENELMPWHYENRFFQEPPEIFNANFDQYFADQDVVKLTADFFSSIGLPVDDLINKSDLYEKSGKYQHAYCMDIDREGDVRVVCNVQPNHQWMGTMLHEFGHAAYDKYIDRSLPWLIRSHAHIFTTEAIAMLFGRFASDPDWLQDMKIITARQSGKIKSVAQQSLQLQMLVFCRWVQVVYRFEKAMYNNPEQDLNTLWWDLVEEYQQLKRPPKRNAPDWAAKIHIALYPVYYHNYMLGELFASQLYTHIRKQVLNNTDGFAGQSGVGKYLKEKVFEPGNRWPWQKLVRYATGEDLNPAHFARQFIDD